MKFRKRLYISEEMRYIILSNLGIGAVSYSLDIYGIFDLSVQPALVGFIIGTIDTIINLFLIRRYIKRKKEEDRY